MIPNSKDVVPFRQYAKIQFGIFSLLLLCLGLGFGTSVVHANDQPIKVALDEKEIAFQQAPFIQNGTTFVQIRPLFETLGIKLEWDGANGVVNGSKSGLSFSLPVGGDAATVNGKSISLEAAALIRNNHTMVPLRLIGEAANVLVLWDPYNRLVLMYGDEYIRKENTTREQVSAGFKVYLEQQKEKYDQDRKKENPPIMKPDPKSPIDNKLKTPASLQDIQHLKGMYYGYQLDSGGYKCGGVCWPKYTFLEGNKLFLGEPDKGGPETINCAKDKCVGYALKNGKLALDNGQELTIQLNNAGEPVIAGVRLTKVEPAKDNLRLNGTYVTYSYNPSGTWSEAIFFNKDGTFTRSKKNGTYNIKGNTITFSYADGNQSSQLFFLHRGDTEAVQIDSKNFNLEKDKK